MGVRLDQQKAGAENLFNMLSYPTQTDLMLVAPQNSILGSIEDSRWAGH
ncbi:hypothetical protein V1277_004907 [Bradyrhizobium sp. AZCC 1588]